MAYGYYCPGSRLEKELIIVYSLTPELRAKLKKPFGLLIPGSPSETMDALEAIVVKEKPPVVIAVGDIVSQNIHERSLHAKLLVTDGRCKRRRVQPKFFPDRRVFSIKNTRGTISAEALVKVRQALEGNERAHLIVDGEEDLLVLVAVLYAPLGGLVIYGQPGRGIVVVRVTEEKHAEASGLFKAMKIVRKAK